jgi:hypothetical protein
MNYEIDIEIDESALDVELLEQPSLALKYGKHWAEKARELTQAEENVKLIRSKLIKEAHEDPDTYLGEGIKPTGPVVEAYYREHEDHIQAKEELVEAQYQLNIAEIAKKEISVTRKSSLANLVELHKQQYFAGPSIPRDLIEEKANRQALKEEKRKEANKKVKITRTTKRSIH